MSFGEYYNGFSQLGGNILTELDRSQQKSALAKLGDQIQGGDYASAARTAFGAGDTQTGLGLLRLLDTQQQRKLTADADAAFAQSFGGFGVGGPVGAPGPSGRSSSNGLPSFADSSGPQGDYLASLFRRESNGNPNAQASTSSARGLGQFTTDTWNGLARKYPNLNLTPVGPGSDGRTDPDQMIRATKALTGDNEAILGKWNLPVTDASRYALHFLGPGGVRLVGGSLNNPDAPATSYASPQAVAANRNVFFNRDGSPKTAGQVMSDFGRSFGGGQGAPQARAPQVASVDPSFAPSAPTPLNRPLAPVQGLNPGRPVQYADDEAQTQALEGRMGMYPPNVYGITPQAAAPAPAQPLPAAPPPASGAPSLARVMTMPAPVQQPPQAPQQVSPPVPQRADAPNPADLPAPNAQPAQFQIPPGPQSVPGSVASLPSGLSSPQPRGPNASPAIPASPARMAPAAPPPALTLLTQSVGPGRVMSMPGDGPGPAAPPAAQTPTDQAFAAQTNALAQAPLGQRIPALLRAVSNPNLSEGPKQVANMLLKRAFDETALPDSVKEFQIARANGWTQAANPAAYAREKLRNPGEDLTGQIDARAAAAQRFGMDPTSPEFRDYALGNKPTRDPGQDLQAQIRAREAEGIRLGMQPGSAELQNYALGNRPAAERQTEAEKITGAIEARRQAAASLGLKEGEPSWRSFVATGKVGADRDMSAADKKLIETADNAVLSASSTISALKEAQVLSKRAYGGPWAGKLATLGGLVGDERATATQNLDNLLTTNALGQLRSIFGGNPTEGERAILLEIEGSSKKPDAVRQLIYERGIKLAQLRLQQNQDKADALREGRYFRQGGNPAQPQGVAAGGQSGTPALPPPSPSNRSGAPSAADRFGQLVGSGMSKAQAYQQLHQEGY